MLCGERLQETRQRLCLLSQLHSDPWIALRCDFVPPATNICIQFISMSILVGCWIVAIEPNPVKGYAECYPQ